MKVQVDVKYGKYLVMKNDWKKLKQNPAHSCKDHL